MSTDVKLPIGPFSEPNIWGWPWHGKITATDVVGATDTQPGWSVALPNSSTHEYRQALGLHTANPWISYDPGYYAFSECIYTGSNWYWKHPSAPAVVRSPDELSSDTEAGLEWRSDAILHEYIRGKIPMNNAIYICPNGRRWRVTLSHPQFSIPATAGPISVTAEFKLFGQFGSAPLVYTVTKSLTLAQLGVTSIPEAATQYPQHRCGLVSLDTDQVGSKSLCSIQMSQIPASDSYSRTPMYRGRAWWTVTSSADYTFYDVPVCIMSILEATFTGDPAASTADFSITVVKDSGACLGVTTYSVTGAGYWSEKIRPNATVTVEYDTPSPGMTTWTANADGFYYLEPGDSGEMYIGERKDANISLSIAGKIVGAWYGDDGIKYATVDYSMLDVIDDHWTATNTGGYVYVKSSTGATVSYEGDMTSSFHQYANRLMSSEWTLYVDGFSIETVQFGVTQAATRDIERALTGPSSVDVTQAYNISKTWTSPGVSYTTTGSQVGTDPSSGYINDLWGQWLLYMDTPDGRNNQYYYNGACTQGYGQIVGARLTPPTSSSSPEMALWRVGVLRSSNKIFRLCFNTNYGGPSYGNGTEPLMWVFGASKAGYAATGPNPVGTLPAIPVAVYSSMPDLYASLHPLTGQIATGDRPVNWI